VPGVGNGRTRPLVTGHGFSMYSSNGFLNKIIKTITKQ
jgi:hypothetical protein